MPRAIPPARVHILLAREARTGLILRRGPSKSVCLIAWDRRSDTFTVGQWLRGRIPERRCDLSSDGRRFLYAATNWRWNPDVKARAWTALSAAPWLKAIGLWSGGDSPNGGGLFLDNNTYWLNTPGDHTVERLAPAAPLTRQEHLPVPAALRRHPSFEFHDTPAGDFPGAYYLRLHRDGWEYLGHDRSGRHRHTHFARELPNRWTLRKTVREPLAPSAAPTASDRDTHSFYNKDGALLDIDCADWEWADLDGQRLVWTARGILHTAALSADRLTRARQLHDFNPLRFAAIQAPY